MSLALIVFIFSWMGTLIASPVELDCGEEDTFEATSTNGGVVRGCASTPGEAETDAVKSALSAQIFAQFTCDTCPDEFTHDDCAQYVFEWDLGASNGTVAGPCTNPAPGVYCCDFNVWIDDGGMLGQPASATGGCEICVE